MVGLVTGGRAPADIADELELATRTVLAGDMTSPDPRRTTTTKIRDFAGETPLQVMAKQGDYESTTMTARERFPYYSSFPFSWYRACDTADLVTGTGQADPLPRARPRALARRRRADRT